MNSVTDDNAYRIGPILVSSQHNEVSREGQKVSLQPKVMAVLDYLAHNRGRVISNEELLDQVWQGRVVTHSSIQKSINALRAALAKLDPEREYVLHFSKRGYQLNTELEHHTAKRIPSLHITKRVVVVILLLAVLPILGWHLTQPLESSIFGTNHQLAHANLFEASWPKTTSHESLVEPHPPSGRIALVKQQGNNGAWVHQLWVRDQTGGEWMVSTARGGFTDVAWSPSGRNLVALEVHSASGAVEAPDFYGIPSHYQTFHIYTLDFKGERLLEKNVLSHWLGTVQSLAWVDENTLEFVASQSPSTAHHRYQYGIPDQHLQKLAPLTPASVPVMSRIYDSKTLLLRQENEEAIISLLDEQQQAIQEWRLGAIADLSWMPGGASFVVLPKSGAEPRLIHLNGEQKALSWPRDFNVTPKRIRAAGPKELLVDTIQPASIHWLWLQPKDGNWHPLNLPKATAFVLFNPADQSIIALAKNRHRWAIWRYQGHKFIKLDELPITGKIVTVKRAIQTNALLISQQGALGAYHLDSGQYSTLLDTVSVFEPLDYNPTTHQVWGVQTKDGHRNIWRYQIKTGTHQQITFASVGTVAAGSEGLYFQTLSQPGVWTVDYASSQIQPISRSLPANSKILLADSLSLYFLTGGPCRESAVNALNLQEDDITTVIEQPPSGVTTADFHPTQGLLARACQPERSEIFKFEM